ncbi:MAG: adenylate/guanylate cyclase domain-containing protein [Dongiaceae bacterium]
MTEERARRRLAAILCADVVGYSLMMGRDEARTLAALVERRRTVVQPLVERHHGRVFKVTGDGVLVEFASAVDAVQCAVALQQAMAAANAALPEDTRIVLRIGVNLGDVMVSGGDLYGDGVNLAARLEAAAGPGEVLLSAAVQDYVRNKVGFGLEDLGARTLKNIAEPVRVFRVAGLGEGAGESAADTALRPSIAVLPFTNMSGEADQEYFSDGITEDIITELSRFSWLFVIARNSSFTYKGRSVEVKQVGRELGVRYLLEGSVRRAGSRVRITAQLIDAATSAHLWADRFDGGLEDIFELQDQVTARVIGAIAPRLEQAEIERAKRKPTASLDAYDYFLQAMACVHRGTKDACPEALRLLYKAIALDPGYAAAHGMAAWCYAWRKWDGLTEDAEAEAAETSRLGRRAAALGQDDAVALSAAGYALTFVGRHFEEGIALIERALALNPNLAMAWTVGGWTRVFLGDPERALQDFATAMRFNPLGPLVFRVLAGTAFAHFTAGRYDDAYDWAQRALRERRATCRDADLGGERGARRPPGRRGGGAGADAGGGAGDPPGDLAGHRAVPPARGPAALDRGAAPRGGAGVRRGP